MGLFGHNFLRLFGSRGQIRVFLFFAISFFTIFSTPVEDVVAIDGTDVFVPGEAGEATTVGRNLVERIHRAGGLGCPYALEFLVLDEHTEFGGLLIVVDDGQRVALLEEIADEYVVLRSGLPDLALDEEREHLTGGHLIVAGGIGLQLLDGEAVADNVGMIDD